MSQHYDVLIIGAGIIGSGIARALTQQGKTVGIVDPTPVGGSSVGNAGLLVPSYATPMSTPENLKEGIASLGKGHSAVTFASPLSARTIKWIPQFMANCRTSRVRKDTQVLMSLANESMALYRQMKEDGLDIGMRESGWLWTSSTQEQAANLPSTLKGLIEAGGEGELVSAKETKELEPSLSNSITGGIWFPHEAVLDPEQAAKTFLQEALDQGAELIREAARAVERNKNQIQSVHTNTQRLTANEYVLATGAYSYEVGKIFGVSIPIEPGYGWSVTYKDPNQSLSRALMSIEDHAVISPIPGRIRITGGMQFGGKPLTKPLDHLVKELQEGARKILPLIDELEVDLIWQGARPMTPSGVPIVKKMGAGNLTIAAGHGPLGVTLAPSTINAVKNILTQ